MQTSFLGPGASPWGSQPGVETPRSSEVTSAAEDSSAATHECRGKPSLHLCPSYQSSCSFCKSSSIILLFSCPSFGYSGRVLYNLAINSGLALEEMCIASTYSIAILASPFFLVYSFYWLNCSLLFYTCYAILCWYKFLILMRLNLLLREFCPV